MKTLKDFAPPLYSPGNYLIDELNARKMTFADLVALTAQPEALLSDLLAGIAPMTEAIANKLESAWGTTAKTWLNLEASYRAKIATTPVIN